MPIPSLLILAGLAATAPKSACWAQTGAHQIFGSAEQARQLQELAKKGGCPVLGFSYSTKERVGYMVYDLKAREIIRVTMYRGEREQKWERWADVTRGGLLADDPRDGIDVGVYSSGQGSAPLSPASIALVKPNAPKGFGY